MSHNGDVLRPGPEPAAPSLVQDAPALEDGAPVRIPATRPAPAGETWLEREARRMTLQSYRDFGPDDTRVFDGLVALAATIFGVPMAHMSLMAENDQWLVSAVGLENGRADLDASVCLWTMAEEQPFVVPDLAEDPRFADLTVVHDLGIRFYAGAQLRTRDGHVLGTFCILDTVPHALNGEERQVLAGLAEQAVEQLELRRHLQSLADELTYADALAEAEERWRLTLDNSPLGMALVSPEGRFTRVNRALCDIVGMSDDEMLTTTFQDITHPEDLAEDEALVAQVLSGEIESYRLQKRYRHAQGHFVWAEISVAMVRNRAGAPMHFVVHVADIDEVRTSRVELQEAAEQLQTRKAFVETLLDTIEVGIVACDADGRLTLFNRAAREWHGLDPDAVSSDELDPETWAERYNLFTADGSTKLEFTEVPLYQALQDGDVTGAEMVIRAGHGREVRVVCVGRAISGPDGEPQGAVVAMSDVTRDREQTTQLLAAQGELAARSLELQRSNIELEHFAAVASHDLRSPLGVIQGYLELLESDYAEALDDQGQSWLRRVQRAASRMSSLVEAMLTYARIGGDSVRREALDPELLLDQVLLDLSGEIVKTGAVVEGTFGTSFMLAAPDLMRQLLQNLLSNALKYRHDDRVPRVHVVVQESRAGEPRGWTISVADNGVGIPESERSRVFDMFAQLERDRSRGHGIGLATCERIVEGHGGKIWVEETPGGGATFKLSIPR